jgi:hypothetical protein
VPRRLAAKLRGQTPFLSHRPLVSEVHELIHCEVWQRYADRLRVGLIGLWRTWKAGFFDFSHCRLFPLEYRLPARFETIPSRPSSHALANTSAPSATRASLNRMQWTPADER